MIRYCEGDIFDSDAEALVNPVNCVGVMGAGLAKQFRERFPDNFHRYQIACQDGVIRPGVVFPTWVSWDRTPYWIVNFPTKDHWRDPSRIEWIAAGLDVLCGLLSRNGTQSIALPRLGCGLGSLAWSDVRPLIERAFADMPDVDVMVYGPPA